MIVGTGIDIIDNRRIEKILNKFGDKFKKRCFHDNEINSTYDKFSEINTYAKRFAAKEAFTKALGTGISEGVYLKDIEIFNNKYGKPFLKLHNNALLKFKKISQKKCNIEISISDEKNYSIANVIIFENE